MPKISEFPRLRSHTRLGAKGQKWVSFYYDMRGKGRPDIPLGTDRDEAIRKCAILNAGGVVEPWKATPKVKKPKVRTVRKLKERKAGKRRAFEAGTWDGLPPWAKRMYLGAETRANERGFVQFLTVSEFRAIIARANGRCELTGMPFDVSPGRCPMKPSIDRIDASRGYVADNVRIVALVVNQALSEWGEAPVIAMAQALLARNGGSASATVPSGQ